MYDRTNGLDGWVSLGFLRRWRTTRRTRLRRRRCSGRRPRPNLYIKIPARPRGCRRLAIFSGVPVVTRYLLAGNVPCGGRCVPQRRRAPDQARLNPHVSSVCVGVHQPVGRRGCRKVPAELTNKLGLAIGKRIYKSYCKVPGLGPGSAAVCNLRGDSSATPLGQHGYERTQGPRTRCTSAVWLRRSR